VVAVEALLEAMVTGQGWPAAREGERKGSREMLMELQAVKTTSGAGTGRRPPELMRSHSDELVSRQPEEKERRISWPDEGRPPGGRRPGRGAVQQGSLLIELEQLEVIYEVS
jgi:hypothetical protein